MNEITLVEQKQNNVSPRLSNLIMSGLFSTGILLLLFSVTRWWWVMAGCVVLILITSFILQYVYDKKDRMAWIGGTAAVLLVMLIAFRRRIMTGLVFYINSIIENWNLKNGSIYRLFASDAVNSRLDRIMFAFIVAFLVAILVNVLIKFDLLIYVVMLQYLAFVLYMLIAALPSKKLIFGITIMSLLLLSLGRVEKRSFNDAKIFWLVMAASVCFIALGSYMLCKRVPGERLEAYRTKTVRYIDRKIYGKSDLPEGDLNRLSEIDDSNSPRLSIKADKAGLFYLRGFTGCSFSDNAWSELDKEAYQDVNKDMLQYMNETKQSPLTMLSTFMVYSNNFQENTFYYEENNLKIKNTGACDKYIYTPYTAQNTSFGFYDNLYKDQSVKNTFGEIKKEYDFSCGTVDADQVIALYNNGYIDTVVDKMNMGIEDGETDYFALEQSYRNYVDTYYMSVPEEEEARINASVEYIPTEVGVESITDYIRQYLLDNTTYTSSVEYSTEAVLMFRHYGVPARYVEGYRCELKEGDNTVTAREAHAWPEVYRYGIGWVPVEVTPGFYDNPEEPQTPEMESVTPENEAETPPPETKQEQDQKETQPEKSGKHGLPKLLIAIIIIILLIIAAIIIRMVVIDNKIKKRINGEDLNDAVLFMAGRLWLILSKFGINIDSGMPLKAKDSINDEFKEESGFDFARIDDILLKAKYSGRDIETDDYNIVRDYYVAVKSKAEKSRSMPKRLLWRLIYVI